jgi:2-polyprenyl-3-methyl-5-hydroxy-6-metoxy-1,4-benzoquinol methylase
VAKAAIAAGCDNPFLERAEVLALVPDGARTILDVGCSRGGFGHALRTADATRVLWGVEADTEAAAAAEPHYDELIVGLFPEALAGREQQFDCVVFNDVLEHIADPWAALRAARARLRPGGTVVASIPNVRFLPVLFKLVVRGEWTYTDTGVLDRGHLRFFTRRSMVELFRSCGFAVDRVRGVNPLTGSRRWTRLLPGSVQDTLYLQFVVVARHPDPSR